MRLSAIEKPSSPLGRVLDFAIRRTLGRSITPSQVIYNRVPAAWRISLAFQLFERFGAKLPHDLLLLVSTQVAMLNGCEFCADIKRAVAVRGKLGMERFDALADWRSHSGWSDRERAAFAYVGEATLTKHVADATFAELRRRFDDREILNLPLEVESDELEILALADQARR